MLTDMQTVYGMNTYTTEHTRIWTFVLIAVCLTLLTMILATKKFDSRNKSVDRMDRATKALELPLMGITLQKGHGEGQGFLYQEDRRGCRHARASFCRYV